MCIVVFTLYLRSETEASVYIVGGLAQQQDQLEIISSKRERKVYVTSERSGRHGGRLVGRPVRVCWFLVAQVA